MRLFHSVLVAFALLPLTGPVASSQAKGLPCPIDGDFRGRKVHPIALVVDGDTLVLHGKGRTHVTDLLGIQANRSEARAFLREELVGQAVFIEYDRDIEADSFGHRPAYVFRVSDGMFLNLELVARGYAVVAHPAGHHESLLLAAQAKAKAAAAGLWVSGGPHAKEPPSPVAVAGLKKTVDRRRQYLAGLRDFQATQAATLAAGGDGRMNMVANYYAQKYSGSFGASGSGFASSALGPDSGGFDSGWNDPAKTVHVRGYYRSNGTWVNPYWRRPPGRR